jgi:hypothetical protein
MAIETRRGDETPCISEVLGNRFERTRLLRELGLVGMEAWLKSGGKARYEDLVKRAIGRPYDGYISDFGRWEREYGHPTNSTGKPE